MKAYVYLELSPFCRVSRPLDILLADGGCDGGEGTAAAAAEALTAVGRFVSSVFTVTLPACGDGGGLLLLDLGEKKRSSFVIIIVAAVACCHLEIWKGCPVAHFHVLYVVVHIHSVYSLCLCWVSSTVVRWCSPEILQPRLDQYLNCCMSVIPLGTGSCISIFSSR